MSGVNSGGLIYFTFLTNWAFINFNIYLIVAALSSTTKFLSVHFICKREESEFSRSNEHAMNKEFLVKKPSGCCGFGDNNLSWYQTVHWFTYVIGSEIAFSICIVYFAVLYRGGQIDGINANTHLVNGLISLADIWISGVPVNFLHFIYLIIYGAIYTIFTGIYYAATQRAIYPVLDYGSNLGLAIGLCVAVVLVFLPLVHIVIFFLQYKAKYWIMYCIYNHIGKKQDDKSDKLKMEEDPETTSAEIPV